MELTTTGSGVTCSVAPARGRFSLARPLADLKGEYFAEYPYLQPRTPDLDLNIVRSILMDPAAIVVTAFDGDKLVGANLSLPASIGNAAHAVKWFERNGLDVSKWLHSLYILNRPGYRAQGVSAAMREALDAEAIRQGYEGRIAMVLDRHDEKAPEGYRHPRGYFLKQGYEEMDVPPLKMGWTDIGDTESTVKQYLFMAKRLTNA